MVGSSAKKSGKLMQTFRAVCMLEHVEFCTYLFLKLNR